jgi:F-type H+-transporting ATPase subunit b
MPQLHVQDFLPQLIWLAITFAVLYLLMARLALPRVGEVIEARAKRIADDLDRATTLKGEAEKARAEHERALEAARTRASDLRRQAEGEAAGRAAQRLAVQNADLTERIKAAETRIGEARAAALRGLDTMAAEAAREAMRRLTGVDVTQADAIQAATSVRERG